MLHLLLVGSLYEPDPESPSGRRRVVFQRTGKKYGNIATPYPHGHQKRAHVIPYDPRTPHQQALRARIAAATAAWHTLTEPERQEYRDQARTLGHTGFNEWISQYCKAHPINPDDYATTDQLVFPAADLSIQGQPASLAPRSSNKTRINLAQSA